MSLYTFIKALENTDVTNLEGPATRRAAFGLLGGAGKRVALAAVPLGLSALFTKAQAKQTAVAFGGALQFALKLQHLEAEFYKMALQEMDAADFPAGGLSAIQLILSHEMAHVNLVSDRLLNLGETPEPKPTFSFGSAFDNLSQFLVTAQAIEELGLRALKGLVPQFIENDTELRLVLGIHAAEARHAAQIRQMRRPAGEPDITPWVTGNNANNAIAAVYAGEENTTQAGTDVASLIGINGALGQNAATQAFDEPLTQTEAETILAQFIV